MEEKLLVCFRIVIYDNKFIANDWLHPGSFGSFAAQKNSDGRPMVVVEIGINN